MRLPPAALVARDAANVLPASGALTLAGVSGRHRGGLHADARPHVRAALGAGVARATSRRRGEPLRAALRDAGSHTWKRCRGSTSSNDKPPCASGPHAQGARWPEQPVDVIVRAYDPSGRLDAAHEMLINDVQIGLDDVPVVWRHVGDSYRARIEPRVPPGPWVVRVHVRDASGRSSAPDSSWSRDHA